MGKQNQRTKGKLRKSAAVKKGIDLKHTPTWRYPFDTSTAIEAQHLVNALRESKEPK